MNLCGGNTPTCLQEIPILVCQENTGNTPTCFPAIFYPGYSEISDCLLTKMNDKYLICLSSDAFTVGY